MAAWFDTLTARDEWDEAPLEDDELERILFSARMAVWAYAPHKLEGAAIDPEDVPLNYLHAQLMQAKNIWTAETVKPETGEFGESTFARAPHPLDWMIKQILRPRRAVPRVR